MAFRKLPALASALLAGGLVLAVPVSAQNDDAATATAEAKEKAKDDELICRTENVIGSRAKKRRTCLTRKQWERVARKGNAFARKLVADNAGGIWDNAPDPGS